MSIQVDIRYLDPLYTKHGLPMSFDPYAVHQQPSAFDR